MGYSGVPVYATPYMRFNHLRSSHGIPLTPSALFSSPATSAACLPSFSSKRYNHLHQGLGVFATQSIGAHELVAEYVGERVNLAEAEKRVARYRQAKLQVSDDRRPISDER